ncbi:MAG: hypothetical protein ACR2IV_03945 [Bryobacteraceae bacterium]
MRKCSKLRAAGLLFWVLGGVLARTQTTAAADVPGTTAYGGFSTATLERAQHEVARIKALVDDGTLPKSRLAEAQLALSDAQDETILAQTLYGEWRAQDMTPEQTKAMLQAAQNRVDRQQKTVDDRQKLLDSGALARSGFAAFQDELASRKRVLELVRNRAKLVQDLQQMATLEQQFERATQTGAGAKYVMIRFEGNGLFNLSDLTAISNQFQKRFHHASPISARGQTLVHQSMGLDHRNRVDVALNPDQPEGIWLRQLLENLHVPYLAFRSALVGAATAPHIHIGTGSTRLKLAQR